MNFTPIINYLRRYPQFATASDAKLANLIRQEAVIAPCGASEYVLTTLENIKRGTTSDIIQGIISNLIVSIEVNRLLESNTIAEIHHEGNKMTIANLQSLIKANINLYEE